MFKKAKASYWLLGITALAVAALLVWPAAALSSLPLEKSRAVALSCAQRGTIEKTLALSGALAYANERYAVAQQTGIAAWVTGKQEGQPVLSGEALVRLDTSAQEALLAKACTEEASAFQMALEQLDLTQAQQTLQLEAAIRQSTVRAYEEGQVLKTLVRPGELVQAGAPVALMASQTQEIRASVGMADRQLLKAGTAVRIEQEGRFLAHGRISSLGTVAPDTTTGLTAAQITIMPATPLPLVLGDPVEVIAILEKAPNVVTVPVSALDQEGQVWQVHEGRAWPFKGRLLLWDETSAWVEGLKEGVTVVLSPSDDLQPGQRVKEARVD